MSDTSENSLEKEPRLGTQAIKQEGSEKIARDDNNTNVNLVQFNFPRDPENPKDWSLVRRWIITYTLCATGFNRIMVSTIMAPALPVIAADFHMNDLETLMSMSVFILATAVGSMVISPLSEVYGRSPILHITNVWFLGWNIVCSFAVNGHLLTAARLLAGLGAGAAYALCGSVLGDVWNPEQRGKSFGFSSLVQNLAAAIGPILGAVITEKTNWRWIFWSTSLLQAAITAVSFLTFRETYAPLILQRRAARLRVETGNNLLFSAAEKHYENRSARWVLQRSLSRPLRLLLFHPVVIIEALVAGFSYGITYLVITTYSDLWTTKYGESVSISGLHYISMCIGSILGAQIGGWLMDLTFRKLKARANGAWTPEYHLPLMLPGTALTVVGLLWYGWSAERKAFWVNVDLGAIVMSFGMQLFGMPFQAYLVDCFNEHASSAQAGIQLSRSLAAFGFPLFAPSMYSSLGYGWANTMLAFVCLVVTIPAPACVWFYGAKIRAKFAISF